MFSLINKGAKKILLSNKTPEPLLKSLNAEEIKLQANKEGWTSIFQYEKSMYEIYKNIECGNFEINSNMHYTIFYRLNEFEFLGQNSTTKPFVSQLKLTNKNMYVNMSNLFKNRPSYLTSVYWVQDSNNLKIIQPNFIGDKDTRKILQEGFFRESLKNSLNELLLYDGQVVVIKKVDDKYQHHLLDKSKFIENLLLKTSGSPFYKDLKTLIKYSEEIKKANLSDEVVAFSKWKYFATQTEKYKLISIVENKTSSTSVFLEKKKEIDKEILSDIVNKIN